MGRGLAEIFKSQLAEAAANSKSASDIGTFFSIAHLKIKKTGGDIADFVNKTASDLKADNADAKKVLTDGIEEIARIKAKSVLGLKIWDFEASARIENPFLLKVSLAPNLRYLERDVYRGGVSEFSPAFSTYVPAYNIYPSGAYALETFRDFPRPFPPRIVQKGCAIEVDHQAGNAVRGHSENDVKLSGVKLADWFKVNYSRFTYLNYESVDEPIMRAELDALFLKSAQAAPKDISPEAAAALLKSKEWEGVSGLLKGELEAAKNGRSAGKISSFLLSVYSQIKDEKNITDLASLVRNTAAALMKKDADAKECLESAIRQADAHLVLGDVVVLMEDRKTGACRAYFHDDKNWFRSGMIFRDGKAADGSGLSGRLLLDEVQAAASYTKHRENDVFYAVISVPKFRSTAMASQSSSGKKEYTLAIRAFDEWSVQAGYFRLDHEKFYAGEQGSTEGASAGLFYSDIVRGKISAGKDSKGWNVFGIEGGIRENTFVSYYYRKGSEKNPAQTNLEMSHTQALGDGVQLSATSQYISSKGKEDGKGTMELKFGSHAVRFGYDGLTRERYDSLLVSRMDRIRSVKTVDQLLLATSEFVNRDLLDDVNRPKWQMEFESAFGKVRLSHQKNDRYGISYTSRGDQTVAVKGLDKGMQLKDLGLYLDNDGKMFLQINNDRVVFGGENKGIRVEGTKRFGTGSFSLKGSVPISEKWTAGALVGKVPHQEVLYADNKPQVSEKSSFFIGAQTENKNLIPLGAKYSISTKLDVLYFPALNIWTAGFEAGVGKLVKGGENGLTCGIGINLLNNPERKLFTSHSFLYEERLFLKYYW